MYLVDSILKNVGGVYVGAFSRNIVETFRTSLRICVQEDQLRLKKLLDTWKNMDGRALFPSHLLDAMDQIVREKLQPLRPPTQIRQTTNALLEQQIMAVLQQKQAELRMNPMDPLIASNIQILGQVLFCKSL
jgi:hypothetical protein